MFYKIVFTIAYLPLFFVLIYTYRNPEKSARAGKRWMNSGEQKMSKTGVSYHKIMASIFLIFYILIAIRVWTFPV